MLPEPTQGLFQGRPTFDSEQFRPLDILASFKKADTWLKGIAHAGIERYQENLYPKGKNYYNHVRVILGRYQAAGESDSHLYLMDWGFPTSKPVPLEPWMLCPDYAHVYRRKDLELLLTPQELLNVALERTGQFYDVLQLLGVALNLSWLQLHEKAEHCSSGGRKLIETASNAPNLFTEIPAWRTPPAAFANDEAWESVSG